MRPCAACPFFIYSIPERVFFCKQFQSRLYFRPAFDYNTNVTKRAIKAPKIFFLDIGLMAFLTKWRTPDQIETDACIPSRSRKRAIPI
jgi:hypothetical protein